MGLFSGIADFAGDVGDIAKRQVKPFVPRNAGETLFALTNPAATYHLSQLHKSGDIGDKAKEDEEFQKKALRRQAIERAMTGGNRLGRTMAPPKPLDLSQYAGSDTLGSILSALLGAKLAGGMKR